MQLSLANFGWDIIFCIHSNFFFKTKISTLNLTGYFIFIFIFCPLFINFSVSIFVFCFFSKNGRAKIEEGGGGRVFRTPGEYQIVKPNSNFELGTSFLSFFNSVLHSSLSYFLACTVKHCFLLNDDLNIIVIPFKRNLCLKIKTHEKQINF